MTQTTERKLFSDPRWSRLEFELPGLGHVTNLTGIVKNADTEEDLDVIDVEFRFGGLEYIEYRGWGGQRSPTPANIAVSHIIRDGSSRNRGAASRDRRAEP